MDLNQLAHRVTNFGQFIASIEYYNRRINLYAVDSNFYEVYYNQETNEIEKVSYAADQDLHKYLNRIKLKL